MGHPSKQHGSPKCSIWVTQVSKMGRLILTSGLPKYSICVTQESEMCLIMDKKDRNSSLTSSRFGIGPCLLIATTCPQSCQQDSEVTFAKLYLFLPPQQYNITTPLTQNRVFSACMPKASTSAASSLPLNGSCQPCMIDV